MSKDLKERIKRHLQEYLKEEKQWWDVVPKDGEVTPPETFPIHNPNWKELESLSDEQASSRQFTTGQAGDEIARDPSSLADKKASIQQFTTQPKPGQYQETNPAQFYDFPPQELIGWKREKDGYMPVETDITSHTPRSKKTTTLPIHNPNWKELESLSDEQASIRQFTTGQAGDEIARDPSSLADEESSIRQFTTELGPEDSHEAADLKQEFPITKMNPNYRNYATKEMANALGKISKHMMAQTGVDNKIAIEDLSKQGGGSVKPAHNSHTQGRDADVALYKKGVSGPAMSLKKNGDYGFEKLTPETIDPERTYEFIKGTIDAFGGQQEDGHGNKRGKIFLDQDLINTVAEWAVKNGKPETEIKDMFGRTPKKSGDKEKPRNWNRVYKAKKDENGKIVKDENGKIVTEPGIGGAWVGHVDNHANHFHIRHPSHSKRQQDKNNPKKSKETIKEWYSSTIFETLTKKWARPLREQGGEVEMLAQQLEQETGPLLGQIHGLLIRLRSLGSPAALASAKKYNLRVELINSELAGGKIMPQEAGRRLGDVGEQIQKELEKQMT